MFSTVEQYDQVVLLVAMEILNEQSNYLRSKVPILQ